VSRPYGKKRWRHFHDDSFATIQFTHRCRQNLPNLLLKFLLIQKVYFKSPEWKNRPSLCRLRHRADMQLEIYSFNEYRRIIASLLHHHHHHHRQQQQKSSSTWSLTRTKTTTIRRRLLNGSWKQIIIQLFVLSLVSRPTCLNIWMKTHYRYRSAFCCTEFHAAMIRSTAQYLALKIFKLEWTFLPQKNSQYDCIGVADRSVVKSYNNGLNIAAEEKNIPLSTV